MKVVLVESPTKVKSIGQFLGSGYKVLSTYGHIRQLPSKTGSVDPESFHFTWEHLDRAKKTLKELTSALKGATGLVLATDPDREGEAIAWHVTQALADHKKLASLPVERITFNAITKSAVTEALKHPRPIDQNLVEAYLARLGLDYLVGFTLSPVLWRKLPGSRSAGRVQSVALRLVAEREAEIEAFKKEEFWTIDGVFQRESSSAKEAFKGQLVTLSGEKLEKFSLNTQALAHAALKKTEGNPYYVGDIKKRQISRSPQPPFTTSTLQQEAFRKLGFSASRTMTLAQKLYEGLSFGGETRGLITYMRTDSISMISEALQACRKEVQRQFSKEYLHPQVRVYKTKTKNAQEAHEAVRPIDFSLTPDEVKPFLDADLHALYTLIWRRAMGSQMANALFDQLTVLLSHPKDQAVFKVTGSTCTFLGFRKLYQEGVDEGEPSGAAEEDVRLPVFTLNEPVQLLEAQPNQHFTQPPPRYSEASLIKKMEEIGIGRPSTYARILQILRERDYVRLEKRQLIPEERGILVVCFLKNFFQKYVGYDFTANLENQLDSISRGEVVWLDVLKDFWVLFKKTVDESQELSVTTVLEQLSAELETHLFPSGDKKCPKCGEGTLGLKLGKFGPFLGCSRYPECQHIQNLGGQQAGAGAEKQDAVFEPRVLGHDPQLDLPVMVKKGPYGYYFQWGEGKKPKRVGLPGGFLPHEVTLEDALKLGALPRHVGPHPETGKEIVGGLGRFGPYLKYDGGYYSVKDLSFILDGSLEDIVPFLQEAIRKKQKKKNVKPRSKSASKAKKGTNK
jgi:DNA topoisomerase-1